MNPPRCIIMKIYHASHTSLYVYESFSASSFDGSHCQIDFYSKMQLWPLGLDQMLPLPNFYLSTHSSESIYQVINIKKK